MGDNVNRPVYIRHKLANVINISKIVTMHYFEYDKNYFYPGESHDFWELVYIDSGSVFITADKNRYTLRQGEILLHKPNVFHTIATDGKTVANVFAISFVSTSQNMTHFKDKKFVLPDNLKPLIKALLKEGRSTFDIPVNNHGLRELKLCKDPLFGGQQMIRTTLEQLLIMLVRAQTDGDAILSNEKENMDNHLVCAVIDLLNDNVYGRITVEEICRELNYSKTYISKIFNRVCGCTIIEYYTKLKINEAKKLMCESKRSITEISNKLYFNDPHYFSRVFKKTTNMTPREYLRSIYK